MDQVVGGLMVYALTPQAASDLSRQIREDRFLKEYLAVIHWRPREEEGTFLDLLGRNPKTRKTYVAKLPGKGIQQAVLHYRVVDSRQGFSLVSIRLETGRTHQIRAQFSSRGLPLAGDRKYSKYPDPPEWQIALWSHHLVQPVDGADLCLRPAQGLADAIGHPPGLVGGEDPERLFADHNGGVLVENLQHGATPFCWAGRVPGWELLLAAFPAVGSARCKP